MKLFSEACEYGLRAVVWLASKPNRPHTVREISEGTQSKPGYLVKVMQRLAKAGILSAQRGVQGGFMLESAIESLTVLDVINAVDPIERIQTCPLGLKAHGIHLCPLHRRLDDALFSIEKGFGAVTIADLINEPTRSKPMCDVLLTHEAGGPRNFTTHNN